MFDPRRDVIVVSGRVNLDAAGRPVPAGETWEWDASAGWRQLAGVSTPVAGSRLAYDRSRGVQILMAAGQTWERSSGPWVARIPLAPALTVSGPLVDDVPRGRILAIAGSNGGGLGRDWAYGPVCHARYERHGLGCPGSLGQPGLSLREPWTLPWSGRTLEVRLDRLPASTAMVVTGTSDTTFPNGSLPLDLATYGMPNCLLRASPELVQPVAGSGNAAVYTIAIPNVAILIGQVFYQQALVPDPAAPNPTGAVMSDSRRFVIGID